MKNRKQILISIIFAAICLFSSIALAADNWQWYECTVTKVGAGGGRYEFLFLGTNMYPDTPASGYNGPIGGTWYEIHPSSTQLQKEILAVVLTASSLGKKVEVLLIPEVTKSIYAIYMKM